MRIKFTYDQNNPRACRVVNADTDEPIEMVQSVAFQINAHDLVPHLLIEVIPSAVEIAAEANIRRRFSMDDPVVQEPSPTILGPGQVT